MDYFGGRALGSSSGRSLSDLDNTDVVDDDGEEDEEADGQLDGEKQLQRRNATSSSATGKESSRSLLSTWTSMFEGGRRSWWVDTAASGFHFVLDAIDKMPQ